VVEHVIDEGSLLELKARYAKELITALARIDGHVVGIIANQPKHLGGVLFVNSADKAARFIQLCNAFNVPLLFLADVPGFMIGSKVEKQGIIRAGAKMVAAVSMATVPRISVVVRKAYGAGLYAMCGPAFEPDACLALPTAQIAVMGPSAAINAVYFNKIQAAPEAERAELTERLRQEYRSDVDLSKLASELVVDDVIPFESLRDQLVRRFELARSRDDTSPARKHLVMPM
jgi:acetyl-CoA carboxylase carboxyltransferase component